jgi:hypothetical protein
MGIFRCSEKVRCLKSIGARNVNVSISSLAAAYTYRQSIDRTGEWEYFSSTGEGSALCFSFTRGIDVRHSHQFEKAFTFLIMFFCDSDCPSTEFIDFF